MNVGAHEKVSGMGGRILLCAGGSGGHVFPAVALAQRLREEGFTIALSTDKRGMRYVPEGVFDQIFEIPPAYLQGGVWQKITALFGLCVGFWRTFKDVWRFNPHVLWGFGAGVSVMPLMAGFVLGKPWGIYQADSVLGRANRLLCFFAREVTLGFKETSGVPRSKKATWVGIPVRPSIQPSPYPHRCLDAPFHLMVVGGSQGATLFSTLVPQAVGLMEQALQKRLHILQQCRPDFLEATRLSYGPCHAQITLVPFVEAMAEALAQSHLVLTRSGASTLGELMCVGRPGVCVPYPHSALDHQVQNAKCVVKVGGGWCFLESQVNAPALAEFLKMALENPIVLEEASKQIQRLRPPTRMGSHGLDAFVQRLKVYIPRRLPSA